MNKRVERNPKNPKKRIKKIKKDKLTMMRKYKNKNVLTGQSEKTEWAESGSENSKMKMSTKWKSPKTWENFTFPHVNSDSGRGLRQTTFYDPHKSMLAHR